MADPHGFLTVPRRELPERRPVPIRLLDYREVYEAGDPDQLRRQASRCMDCGVPFCHQGCPLGNLIPEFNDAMYRGELPRAVDLLHATNNFPEFTGRACPAPCENACVLSINQPAVTIKQVEVSIVDQGFAAGLIQPEIPDRITGHTVAVIGSGPAGLAAAQQLTRAGHTVVVYERDDRLGGLLRYGIPDFKLEKQHIDRRLSQMRAEGTRFETGVEIGVDLTLEELRSRFDAVIVCTGATVPRDMPVEGRELDGVEFAMDYLVPSNRAQAGDEPTPIDAEGKHVIIIGGGDTGADCLGTALRQKAASVTTLAIGAKPPAERSERDPWPTVPRIFEVQTSHEEGGERKYLASTTGFVGDAEGRVNGIAVAETQFVDGRRIPTPGTEHRLDADLVLLALGFSGPEAEVLGLDVAETGAFARDDSYAASAPGVFVAGDAGRGQSLIVWAIAEGRAAAAEVDRFLTGSTRLPEPVRPRDTGFKG
ncbi:MULTISPECIES: glutamate synthase subunit beta [Brevibacterium]|uniref:Glutamate synthase subunit beta n=2 Tax=Brevibacterium casei TaxID=33889 RepID=K9APN4_9MICO|nr:glutamate synthase subunit beta [Brevibacterium casei]NJE68316.1 glutamate synthase subunit beta [Brevibacterium sp. LS14]EKU47961.1 glutamate synthase subunit beta [Brevibacterium casei S18]MBE4693923.1 glutamate synthase subunit beta [Brevibacterium casei]MBY3577046.1 glutamate synthase subunit beta [Brevibacterium casei]MCT1446021.1 glutamate synthase subunit beta [Brevibacterium casei]